MSVRAWLRVERKVGRAVRVTLRLVLLCHKLRKQQGHRGSLRARTWARLMRMVAIELRTWRSGRGGGSAGSIIFG